MLHAELHPFVSLRSVKFLNLKDKIEVKFSFQGITDFYLSTFKTFAQIIIVLHLAEEQVRVHSIISTSHA